MRLRTSFEFVAVNKIGKKVISVKNVSKVYSVWNKPSFRFSSPIYSRLLKAIPGARIRAYFEQKLADRKKDFFALDEISFDVFRGQSLGILGRNGSGKSTLLQIIAGTLQPTTGTVEVDGRVAALLELGSGFNPDFTGKENVYLNGSILGIGRKEMDERYDEILSFADIGSFVDQPIKTYSSGMVLRLAFAVQILVDPDILIVDEALSVGDSLFQKRCFQRINELVNRGTTLLFVSHDVDSVNSLTEQALFLNQGKLRTNGATAEVVLDYRRFLHQQEKEYLGSVASRAKNEANLNSGTERETPEKSSGKYFGDLDAEIVSTVVFDEMGEELDACYPGDFISVRVEIFIQRPITKLNIGLRIRSKEGVKMYSWGTLNQDLTILKKAEEGEVFWQREFSGGERFSIEFKFRCNLGPNFYEIQSYVSQEKDKYFNDQRMLHWVDEAAFLNVGLKREEYFFGGVCDLRMRALVDG